MAPQRESHALLRCVTDPISLELMKYLAAFALLSTLALSACASSSTKTGDDLVQIVKTERAPVTSEKCTVPINLVGQPHTELSKMKFAVPIRVIFPGTPVTGDNIANRLNFKVDKKGIIREITCG